MKIKEVVLRHIKADYPVSEKNILAYCKEQSTAKPEQIINAIIELRCEGLIANYDEDTLCPNIY